VYSKSNLFFLKPENYIQQQHPKHQTAAPANLSPQKQTAYRLPLIAYRLPLKPQTFNQKDHLFEQTS
jgi:hypothetical protein